MIDFKFPINIPSLDFSQALPLLALIIIAALILVTLILRAVIRSRAFAIAAVAAIVILGSSTIVGGLGALTTLIAIIGSVTIVGLILLSRNPDLLALARLLLERRSTITPAQPINDQPTAETLNAPVRSISKNRRRTMHRITLPKDLGF